MDSTPPSATRAARRSIVDAAEWLCVVDRVPAPACMAWNVPRLAAAYLADDETGQVLPQGTGNEVRDRVLAHVPSIELLAHTDAGLQGHDVRAAGLQVGQEFVVGLQSAETAQSGESRR